MNIDKVIRLFKNVGLCARVNIVNKESFKIIVDLEKGEFEKIYTFTSTFHMNSERIVLDILKSMLVDRK